MANDSFSKGLPSSLGAPAFVDQWRRRALRAGLILAVVAVVIALLAQKFDGTGLGWDHFLRGWLEGFVGCFGLCFGGMALLMVQYLSGGKWGLIIRRPLEAMTRTWPLIVLLWIPVAVLGATYQKLYPWARYSDWATALKNGQISVDHGARHSLEEPHVEHDELLLGLSGLFRDLCGLHPAAQSLVAATRRRQRAARGVLADEV